MKAPPRIETEWKTPSATLHEAPPVPCDFSVGDRVIFTNDHGAEWDMVVIGFAAEVTSWGRFIYTDFHQESGHQGAAWWFPKRQDQIKHI